MHKGAIAEKRFEYKGFPCVVVMQAMCFRTGYVGIPKGHALYGKEYDSVDIDCHGGLTYSRDYLVDQSDKDVWWIGYDTGHYLDGHDVEAARELFKDYPETLKMIESLKSYHATYADYPGATLAYCEMECRKIVDQILEMDVLREESTR